MKEAFPSQISADTSAISSCSNASVLLVNFDSYMEHELGLSPATISGRIFVIRHYLQTCGGAPGTNIFSLRRPSIF
nr:Uncharacterised protein [Escherichia coli]